ncbi:4Fe-4S binding protein [bacterium]|nr:4Fe-4S binding protein [bacterium]
MIVKRILIILPKTEIEKPIVNDLIKYYDLTIKIIRAKITPEEEGYILIDIIGAADDIERGMKFLDTLNIHIQDANKGLQWNEEKCTCCGNCLSHCPTASLTFVDRVIMKFNFNKETCIECLNCIKNCPYGAFSSIFEQK